MNSQIDIKYIFDKVFPTLNEGQRRIFLGAFAKALGRGGIEEVFSIGVASRNTIRAGIKELEDDSIETTISPSKSRKEGGGRKTLEETQPGITKAIIALVEDQRYGNPENPLVWTTKSTRNIVDELSKQGFSISNPKVGDILRENGYSLQQNSKLMQVGPNHPDRDLQFKFINETVKQFIDNGSPAISIDCKKKENVGNFKNNGSEYAPKKDPVKVLDYDFTTTKASPFGIYDIASNDGYVNVGISSDTAEFAVNSIRSWWNTMGILKYEKATDLLITCDGGGSNGSRNRLWKMELQKFSDETGLNIHVTHFPPGTSKWNKIEHRMFSYISKNWRGRPLTSYQIIVSLIANTTTESGLTIECALDGNEYLTGIKVSDEDFATLNINRNAFHGEWNYSIMPRKHLC